MKLLGLLFFPILLSAQVGYVAQKTTTLSGAAEVITIQQPASNAKVIEFKNAYVGCSVLCTVTLERNGTGATSTALTPVNINPGEKATAVTAFHTSNVGSGSVINVVSVPAGSFVVLDLTGIYMEGTGSSKNLTVRTSSITGDVYITIKWTER